MQVSRREPKKDWQLYTFDFGTVGFVLQPSIIHVHRTSHRPNLTSTYYERRKKLERVWFTDFEVDFSIARQSSCNSCNVPSPSRGDWNVIGLHSILGIWTSWNDMCWNFWAILAGASCFQDDMNPWSQRHSFNTLQQSEIQSLQEFSRMVFQLMPYSPIETSRLQISECQSISNLVACSCRACSCSHAVLWRLPQFWWTLGKPTRPTKSLDATGWVTWKQRGWKMWKMWKGK